MKPNPEQKADMLKRLARIEGQVRGIQKLIDADEDCEKVLQQMTAARSALDRAFFEMMACIIEAGVLEVATPEAAQRMTEVRKLLSKYA